MYAAMLMNIESGQDSETVNNSPHIWRGFGIIIRELRKRKGFMNLSAEWLLVAPKEEQAQELWIDAETKRQQDEAEELYALWLAEKAQKVHA